MRPSAALRSEGEIRVFRSAAERDAEENLIRFIERARQDNPIGVKDWNAPRWDYPRSGRASKAGDGGLQFTLRSPNSDDPGTMPEPFMSFVKAIVCVYNQRTARLYDCGQSQMIIAAARLLYQQIADRGGLPGSLRHGDFDAALQQAREERDGDGAVAIGTKLKVICEEMDRHRLTPMPIGWQSSLRAREKHDRVGEKATARRHAKLPTTEVIDALAEISARIDLPDRELILQRAIDLLFCGGFRLNEALTLPRNAWLEEAVKDEFGEQMLDSWGKPAIRVGLRYWPEKGGHEVAQIKWLPTAVIDVARRAIDDILRITAPFHEVALRQAGKPGITKLGEPWDGLPSDHLLSTKDVAAIVGLKMDDPSKGSAAGRQFLEEGNVPVTQVRLPLSDGRNGFQRRQFMVKKGDLEACLRRRSLHGNVLGDIGYLDVSDCLFLLPLFFLKTNLACGLNGTVQLVTDAMIQVYLISQANGIQPSIFERLGYKDEDGNCLHVTSHQFRHLLNTLAQEGGMSQMDIARWMGRAQLAQNAAYDHVSPLVRAQRIRERTAAGGAIGPVAEMAAEIRDPVRREEFIASNHQAAHETDLGLCVHPWDAMPCAELGACEGCGELRVIKGEAVARGRACETLARTERLLAIAAAEEDDDTYGADNWREAQRASAAGLRRIIAVHDDQGIPDGTVVQLPMQPRRGGR